MTSEDRDLAPEPFADHWLWVVVKDEAVAASSPPPDVELGPVDVGSASTEVDPVPQACLPHSEPQQAGPPEPVEQSQPAPAVDESDSPLHEELEADQPALSKFAEAANLHRLGRWQEAQALYARIPESDESYPDALVNLIAIAAAGNDSAKLHQHGEQLLNLRRNSRPALEALMQTAMAAGDYKAAARHGARLVKQAADSHQAWFNLGLCYHKTGHYEQAAQAYTEAIKLRPDATRARANLGVLLQTHGDIAAARHEFEQVLHVEPDNWPTVWNLALIREKEGQIAQAEKAYLRLIREEFQVYTVAFRLGRARLNRKNYLGAVEAFERCLLERPGDAAAEVNLMLALRGSGDLGDSDLGKHADTVEGLALQAAAAVEANEWRRAHDIEARLNGKGENTAVLSYNIGVLQQRENLVAEAIQSYEKAVAQQPDFAEAHLNRGHVLMRAGQPDQARAAWKDALEGKPGLADGYFKGATFSQTPV